MIIQSNYIDYLLSTPKNYTCTHLAAHLPDVSHDQVNRFLRDNSFSSSQLHQLVLPLLHDSPEAWVLTNHLAVHLTREMVIDAVEVCWQLEEFHRSFKQLTGAEKC